MKENVDRERLEDILQSIADIEEIAREGHTAFFASRRSQAAALYRLGIIGEAASKLSNELKTQYPDVPWKGIIAFRNIAFHEYGKVDLAVAWDLVSGRVPELKQHILSIVSDQSGY